ncbi:MAG: hypothetical protein ACXVX0_05170 [Blastococcus sp.]
MGNWKVKSRRQGMAAVLTAGAALSLLACSPNSPRKDARGPGGTDSTPAALCRTPTLDGDDSFSAAATGGQVNALVFGSLPPRVGTDLKVVWRVTGDGNLVVAVERPDGTKGHLTFGPEPHGSSNFSRPGAEWGTGFHFDQTGCWHLDVERGAVHAHVSIEVVA